MIVLIAAAVISSVSFSNVELVRVVDGDNIVVNLPSVSPSFFSDNISVRVLGINTPEARTKRLCEKKEGLEAKHKLEALSKGQRIDLNFCQKDKFWRIDCAVRIGEQIDVGSYMIEQGLAVPFSGQVTKPIWKCK